MIKVNDIKAKISPLEIYGKLIPGLTEQHIKRKGHKGAFVSSPLASDTNPSFQIREGRNGDLIYHCFSTDNDGDAIDLYARVKGLDPRTQFPAILEEINREFGLGLNGSAPNGVTGKNWGATYYEEFTPDALQWCSRFKIEPATLQFYGVRQIKEAWFLNREGEKRKIKSGERREIAFNVGVNCLKFYQPGWGQQKKKTYRGPGSTDDNIFGLAQLPSGKVEILLIVEGEKDVLCAASHGFYAICFQSAVVKPTKGMMRKVREKANELIICYDNDQAGQAGAKWVSAKYDLPVYELPKEYNDLAEYLPANDSHADELRENLKECWQGFRVKNGLTLVERNGRYWKPDFDRTEGKYKWNKLKAITNFRMEVEAFIASDIDSKRVVRLISEKGEIKTDTISTDVFTSPTEWKKFLGQKGNFFFYGGPMDLTILQRMTFEMSENAEEVNALGYSKRYGVWVLGNGIVKGQQLIAPDKIGMVEGLYLPWTAEGNEFNEDYLDFRRCEFRESSLGVSEWFQAISECYGIGPAIMGAAFITASLNFDFIAHRHKHFPELMVWGQRGSGKNSFVEFLLSLFGEIKTSNLTNVTVSHISRSASQAHNIPKWFDEYGKEVPERNLHALKGWYDLTARGTGVKDQTNRTKEGGVTRPVIITGQELPTDNEALLSRMLLIQFDQIKDDPDRRRAYERWKLKLNQGMGKALLQLINMREIIVEKYPSRLQEISLLMSEEMIAANLMVDSRLVGNYAWVVTPLIIAVEAGLPIFGDNSNPACSDLLNYVLEFMKRQAESEATADEVNIFWKYFLEMIEVGKLIQDFHFAIDEVSKQTYLGIRGIAFSEFTQHYQNVNRKAFIPDKVLIAYLRKRPYYFGYDKKVSYYKTISDSEKARRYDDEGNSPKKIQAKGDLFHFELLPDFVKEFFTSA